MWNDSSSARCAFDDDGPIDLRMGRPASLHILRAKVTFRPGTAVVTPPGWTFIEQHGRTVLFEHEDDGRYGTQWIGLPHDAFERLELTHATIS